jgi:zinc protease
MGRDRRRCRLCRILSVTVSLHLVTQPLVAQEQSALTTHAPVPPSPAPSESALALAPVATSAAVPAGSVAAMLARVVHDTTLDNGLQVIVIENHSTPLATVEIVFHTGAFTQEPGDQGVPHLYEHMLFKSYKGPGDRSWNATMSKVQGNYNGETADEAVRYHVTVPSDNVEGAMRALAELVRDPEFTQQNLNEERSVVFDELDRARSNPLSGLYDQVNRRLWTTAWGRKDPGGDAKTLIAVSPQRLDQIFHRYYVPNNAAVIVSGDVTPAQAFQLAHERFDHWKRQPDPFAGAVPYEVPPLKHSAAVIIQDKVPDVLLLVEWQGPSVTTDPADTYAADMLASILDDPVSTFHQRLIDTGLFASCSIGYLTRSHVGPIMLTAHTSLDSLTAALTALSYELQHLDAPNAFLDEELVDARRARRVELALELEHQMSMAFAVADFWSSSGLDYFRTYTDAMEAVSRADLQRFAKRYIVGAPMAVGALVPPTTGNSLRATIAAFLPPS